MGIPGFYTWLVRRYPFIKHLINQNIPYIDCFYMDLNTLIYKCTNDEIQFLKEFINPTQFDEIWAKILNYLNELINIIQPRKLLFLAFDGVAPKAKVNPQRCGRLMSFKTHSETENLTQNLANHGMKFEKQIFKNMSITPGTAFMTELNKAMKFYIKKKFHEDSKWKNLKVVYSGGNVPGEGEHKIFDFMRQVHIYGFKENFTHCIYGSDADLIMLSMCSSLKNIVIIREINEKKNKIAIGSKHFQERISCELININILRDCFLLEFKDTKIKMGSQFDLKNVIDDFIFICFFMGNDFLPKMFCFDIKKGHLEKILMFFKEFLVETKSYLVQDGNINFKNFELFLKKMVLWESKLFGDTEEGNIKKNLLEKKQKSEDAKKLQKTSEEIKYEEKFSIKQEIMKETVIITEEFLEKNEREIEKQKEVNVEKLEELSEKTEKNEQTMKKNEEIITDEKEPKNCFINIDFREKFFKIYHDNREDAKSFYYTQKLRVSYDNKDKINEIISKYIEGLQFVTLYYFFGCPSWNWFYPYYFMPLISDLYQYLVDMNKNNMKKHEFQLGEPLPIFQQLLAVMPLGTIHLLPEEFSNLITNPDGILRKPIDYYPTNFEIDQNDGPYESSYLAILPFMNDELLEKVYLSVDQNQMKEEIKERGKVEKIFEFYYKHKGIKTSVLSFLPNFSPNFDVKINETEFSFEDLIEGKFLMRFTSNIDNEEVCRFNLPTLRFFPLVKGHIDIHSFFEKVYDTLFIEIIEKKMPENECKSLLNQSVYFIDPNKSDRLILLEGEVMGFINSNILFQTTDLCLLEKYNHQHHQDFFRKLTKELTFQYRKLNITTKFSTLFFIIKKNYNYNREINGDFSYGIEEYIVPAQMIDQRKSWAYINEAIPFNFYANKLQINSKVIILKDPTYVGYYGKIAGINKKTDEKIVKIQKKSGNFSKDMNFKGMPMNYISIMEVCKSLKLHLPTILILLDSIIVSLDPSSETFAKFEKVDIGLNLLNKDKLYMVPGLIICKNSQELQNGYIPNQKLCENLELCEGVVKLLYNYHENFEDIVKIINKLQKKEFTSSEFFPDKSKDSYIEIMRVYVWLVSQNKSQLSQEPMNSEVFSKADVEILEKLIQIKENNNKSIKFEIEFNRNFIFVKNHKIYIPPFYKDHPQHHELNDRVLLLNTQNTPFGFGKMGTIIGIIDRKIEVLFDEPFIGGSNLGGKCNYWRGALLDFIDVFNLTRWPDYLEKIQNGNKWKGWNYNVIPFRKPHEINLNDKNSKKKDNINPFLNPFKVLENSTIYFKNNEEIIHEHLTENEVILTEDKVKLKTLNKNSQPFEIFNKK